MSSLRPSGLARGLLAGGRRPIVVVEDHLHHVTELLAALAAAAPDVAPQVGVVCLGRRGPDTERAVAGWLADYPGIAVQAEVERGADGLTPLDPAVFVSAPRLAALLSSALRPG